MGPVLRRILVLAAAGAALVPASARAATFARYASPTGSTTDATCTNPSTPCSLPHAIGVSHDGDDVTVLPGTYTLGSQLITAVELNLHGVAGQPRPVIVAVGGFNFPIIFSGGGGSLRHLSFKSSPGDGFVLDLTVPLIEDISVSATGVTGAGILLRQGSAVTTLRDSTVNVTASPNASGIEARGADLRNVTVYAGGTGSVGVLAHAPGGSPLTVNATNVIAHGTAADFAVLNDAAAPGATLNIDHSAFAGTPANTGLGNTVTITHRVSAPPLLKDPANGDFHELAGSPTIDAGIIDPANGTTDPDGTSRTVGPATDIGAFEFMPPPMVTTGPATGVTTSGATLNGSVNPNGTATTAQFVIDTGPGSPITLTAGSLPADGSDHAVSANVAGLTPGTTYTYHLHASNPGGANDGQEQTFTTAIPQRPAPPVLRLVRLTRLRFAAGSKQAFTYTLSEPATITIVIVRRVPGRLSHKRCVAPRKGLRTARRCTRSVGVGSLTRRSAAGSQRIPFSGLIGRKKLPPGNYVATVTASDSLHQRSRSFAIPFTIVRGK